MRVVEPFDSQQYDQYQAQGLDISHLIKAKVAGHGVGKALALLYFEQTPSDDLFEAMVLSEFGSLKAFLETDNLIRKTDVRELVQRLVKAGCFEAELRAAAMDYDGTLSQALGYADDALRVYGGALGEYLLHADLTNPSTGSGNGKLAQIEVLLHRAQEEWQASRILGLAQDLSDLDKRYLYREIVQKKLLAMWPTVQLEHCLYLLSELEEHLE